MAASPDPLLVAIDAKASFKGTDFAAQYTVVQKKANQGESSTTLAVFRRDSEDKYVLVVLEPVADRGKGVLKIGNNLWKYDPASKRFEVSSAKDRLQNSSVRFSDFSASTFAKDYTVVAKGSEKLGATLCTVLTLEAVSDTVPFARVKIWVSADHLIRMREDYSLSGQLLRTTAIPSYAKSGNYSVPNGIVVVDQLSGKDGEAAREFERTLVSIKSPQFGKQDDLTFSQAYIEKLSR